MIKFLDLHKINERFRKEIDERLKNILDCGWYLQGKENDSFAQNFANYCGTKYALGVANGLDAINLIIKAYGFSNGDEIIVPANTFIATILAVSQNNCTPVFVEPNINTYCIDPDLIEEKITEITEKGKSVLNSDLFKLASNGAAQGAAEKATAAAGSVPGIIVVAAKKTVDAAANLIKR